MQAIFIYVLKACIYSGIFFLYYFIALRNKRFHYYNRFYLLMSAVLSLLLPLLHIAFWQWHSANPQIVQLINVMLVSDGVTMHHARFPLFSRDSMPALIYAAVAVWFLLALIFGIARIFRLRRRYPVEKMDSLYFINTDLEGAPFSFLNNLFWRNTMDIRSATGKQIFRHELTHIEQKHSLDKLFMRLLTAILWINPFYWLVQKELSLIHEFIADEKAIENKNAEAFALMLLQAQYGKAIFSPAQSFNYSPIKRRLVMLTTSREPRFSYARRVLVLPLLALTVLLFAFKLKEERNIMQSNTAAGQQVDADPEIFDRQTETDTAAKKPLYLVDGKEATAEEVQKLDASTIESINVIKEERAIKKWGKKGENGVVLITLKSSQNNQQASSGTYGQSLMDSNLVKRAKKTLKIVDGKILTNDDMEKLDAISIESMTVLQGADAVNKYGEKGINGVIEIKTRNSTPETTQASSFSPPVIAEDKNDSTVDFTGNTGLRMQITARNSDTGNIGEPEKVFTTVQTPATPPLGLKPSMAMSSVIAVQDHVKNNYLKDAPNGKYTVNLTFTVDENGYLKDIKAIYDPGYGIAAEAERMTKQSPRWTPAKQNNISVASYAQRTIIFYLD